MSVMAERRSIKVIQLCSVVLLLVNISYACVPLLNACVQSVECCSYPNIVCRAGACFAPRMRQEAAYNGLIERFVDENNEEQRIREALEKSLRERLEERRRRSKKE